MEKTVIGLIGQIGSGKGTFVRFLRETLSEKRIAHIKSSDILIKTLKLWHIPPIRKNLQKLPEAMECFFGIGILSNAVFCETKDSEGDIVVFDCIRQRTDLDMVRTFPQSIVVFMESYEKIRYERIKNRGEKPEETSLSFGQFKEEGQTSTEPQISELGSMADFKITNNGTLEEFGREIRNFCAKLLKTAD